jgi:hypothetical protein
VAQVHRAPTTLARSAQYLYIVNEITFWHNPLFSIMLQKYHFFCKLPKIRVKDAPSAIPLPHPKAFHGAGWKKKKQILQSMLWLIDI